MREVASAMMLGLLLMQNPAPEPQQASKPDTATFRVNTKLVNVMVNVTDDKGAPVGGLTQDDFMLSEDRKLQKIAVFERESAAPLSIVLAIDISGSVFIDQKLEQDAARHFVKALLRPQDELDLMAFDQQVREVVPFTNDTKRIENGLHNMGEGEATALFNAVFLGAQSLAALQHPQDTAPRRKVIVIISDGEDTVHGVNYMKAVAEAQRADAMVFSIIMVPIEADAGRSEGGEHALIEFANDTGGKYYYVTRPKELDAAFEHVSDDLRTQYLLGYYAPQHRPGEEFHTILVNMKTPALAVKYQVRHRTGYYSSTR